MLSEYLYSIVGFISAAKNSVNDLSCKGLVKMFANTFSLGQWLPLYQSQKITGLCVLSLFGTRSFAIFFEDNSTLVIL